MSLSIAFPVPISSTSNKPQPTKLKQNQALVLFAKNVQNNTSSKTQELDESYLKDSAELNNVFKLSDGKLTQQELAKVVILFLQALPGRASIADCFTNKQSYFANSANKNGLALDREKFYTFLKNHLRKDTSLQDSLNKIPEDLIEKIRYYPRVSAIAFDDKIAISTHYITNEKHPGSIVGSQKLVSNKQEDRQNCISNEFIRQNFSEGEIRAAKAVAVTSLIELIKPALANESLTSDEKVKIVTEIIYLHRILNLATRKLLNFKTGYNSLSALVHDLVSELRDKSGAGNPYAKLDKESQKSQFINDSVFVNFHRNVGMAAKRLVKVIIATTIISLPLLTYAGMMVMAWGSLQLLGLIGLASLFGVTIESIGDLWSYVNMQKLLNKIWNSGDSLNKRTDTYLYDFEPALLACLNEEETILYQEQLEKLNLYTTEELITMFDKCKNESNILHITHKLTDHFISIRRGEPIPTQDKLQEEVIKSVLAKA